MTRGEDKLVAAEALSDLSDVAAAKGARDIVSGEETLDAAEQVQPVASLATMLSEADLFRMGRQLRGMAVNEIGRAMGAAVVAAGMEDLLAAASEAAAVSGVNQVLAEQQRRHLAGPAVVGRRAVVIGHRSRRWTGKRPRSTSQGMSTAPESRPKA